MTYSTLKSVVSSRTIAVGDVNDHRDKQVIITAADGAKTVLAAYNYLVHQIWR
ncbi:MAG: hypothetical protein JAY75_23225 [Candidatus Thiodiazotropha taylori]|nr:hypothetical protein [Candidatus Thiodiazotropha sp. (ex Lucina pensylvanica)]MCG7879637.1 hypothetical protein [Candidatus Thiodiazotropha taylori]MCG8025791.1 hypothetical protein [Candidatus Thiodiazotropha endolucinida]MCG7880091.1 hypothetical protein [Candidatus Thiodiazotropha taylori]MCG7887952.1 hypothetical protein [Candidatus Thiodiazotropha taylori]